MTPPRRFHRNRPTGYSPSATSDQTFLTLGAKRVTATVLDNDRDCLDCPVEFRNGKVRLTRAERRSAAFMVTFEL